jgi:cytochrome c-type biogenesis protein CcmH/NrfG
MLAGLLAAAGLLAVLAFGGLIASSALAAAEDAAAAGRSQDQSTEARKAMHWAPWSSEPWRLLGEAQLAGGTVAAARASFRHAIAIDRRSWILWYDLALATSGPDQKRALGEARRLNPLSVEVAQLASALRAGRRGVK